MKEIGLFHIHIAAAMRIAIPCSQRALKQNTADIAAYRSAILNSLVYGVMYELDGYGMGWDASRVSLVRRRLAIEWTLRRRFPVRLRCRRSRSISSRYAAAAASSPSPVCLHWLNRFQHAWQTGTARSGTD